MAREQRRCTIGALEQISLSNNDNKLHPRQAPLDPPELALPATVTNAKIFNKICSTIREEFLDQNLQHRRYGKNSNAPLSTSAPAQEYSWPVKMSTQEPRLEDIYEEQLDLVDSSDEEDENESDEEEENDDADDMVVTNDEHNLARDFNQKYCFDGHFAIPMGSTSNGAGSDSQSGSAAGCESYSPPGKQWPSLDVACGPDDRPAFVASPPLTSALRCVAGYGTEGMEQLDSLEHEGDDHLTLPNAHSEKGDQLSGGYDSEESLIDEL